MESKGVPTGEALKRRVSLSRFNSGKSTPLDAASRGKGILRRPSIKLQFRKTLPQTPEKEALNAEKPETPKQGDTNSQSNKGDTETSKQTPAETSKRDKETPPKETQTSATNKSAKSQNPANKETPTNKETPATKETPTKKETSTDETSNNQAKSAANIPRRRSSTTSLKSIVERRNTAETPAKETPAKETPAKETPAKETPASRRDEAKPRHSKSTSRSVARHSQAPLRAAGKPPSGEDVYGDVHSHAMGGETRRRRGRHEVDLNMTLASLPSSRRHGDERHGDERHGDRRHGDERHGDERRKLERRASSRGPRRTPSVGNVSSRSSRSSGLASLRSVAKSDTTRDAKSETTRDRNNIGHTGGTNKVLNISPRYTYNQSIEPALTSFTGDLSDNLAHVSSTVDYLSKQLLIERQKSKQLMDQIGLLNSEAFARGDAPLMRACPNRVPETDPSKNSLHLFHRLEEERQRAAALQESYEQQLAKLRAENVKRIAVARQELLTQVDGVLKKYAKLANDAYNAAKKAQHQSDAKTIESRKIADAACAAFEKECKTKMRDVLEGYKYLADQAAQQAQQETKALKEKCREMTARTLSDKNEFEAKVLELSENKVAPFRKEIINLKRENAKLKEEAENTFRDIKAEVTKQFEIYENSLLSESLEILWSHKIPMSEAELRLRVADGLKAPIGKTDKPLQCHCQAPCTQPCPCPCSACKPIEGVLGL